MLDALRILGIIPARGGSKRLPRKNILPFAGKPLLAWSIEQARASTVIDRCAVSTDDDEIVAIARQYRAEVVRRPAELATDMATTYDAIIHTLDALAAGGYAADLVVVLQPTSPLRVVSDIGTAVQLWCARPEAMVVSVCPLDRPVAWSFYMQGETLTPILGWDILTQRSQDVPTLFIPNGAIFVFTPADIRARRCMYGSPILPHIMPVERSIDIDTAEDFDRAEQLMFQRA